MQSLNSTLQRRANIKEINDLKNAALVHETLKIISSASMQELDSPLFVKKCNEIYLLSQPTYSTQRILGPSWKRLCEVFERLWSAKDQGEFTLNSLKAQADKGVPASTDAKSSLPNPHPQIVQVFYTICRCVRNLSDEFESVCTQVLEKGLLAMFAKDLSSELFLSHMNELGKGDIVSRCMRGYMDIIVNSVRRANLNVELVTSARTLGFVGILTKYTKSTYVNMIFLNFLTI